MRKGLLIAAFAALLAIGLVGCSSSDPVVGKWKNLNSGNYEEFYSDGTLSYTNSHFSELGLLEGTWEPYETPTINIGGEEYNVYLTTNEVHKIEGINEERGKEDRNKSSWVVNSKYVYSDGDGDWLFITNGDEGYICLPYDLDIMSEEGEIDKVSLEVGAYKKAN